jgi:hypothetical protein
VLQLLMTDDVPALSDIDDSHQADANPAPGDHHSEGRLSTIPEGSHETEPSDDYLSSVGSYLQHADQDLQESLNQVSDLLDFPLPEKLKEKERDELHDRLPLALLSANIDEVTLAEPSYDLNASHVELAVYPPMTDNLGNLPRKPHVGDRAVADWPQHRTAGCCAER